jgi:hypothetical protein
VEVRRELDAISRIKNHPRLTYEATTHAAGSSSPRRPSGSAMGRFMQTDFLGRGFGVFFSSPKLKPLRSDIILLH